MRLSTSLLLPLYAGAATAIPDAKVYIFPDNGWSNAANPPALSPEETRLVFAQRLGVSQYHSLDGAADDTLSYINRFGGRQMGLFETMDDDKAAELVLFVEGASAKNAGPFLDAWSSIQPAFTISNPPSSSENLELVFQMDRQLGSTSQDCPFEEAINPGNRRCWKGKSKIIQIDLADERPGISKVMLAQDTLVRLAQAQKMNAVVVLMPESSWSTKSKNSYGIYEKLSQKQISRRELAEEPVTETSSTQATKATASSPPKYIRGVAPLCYSTLKSCQSSTNNCSGHGECYMKSNGTSITESCYACQCIAVYKNVTSGSRPYTRTTYWGGGACQKEDVSEPFWLLTILTVVLVGIIAWTIGMMYSIGEEKLPGVIGAGVSSRAG